MDVFAQRKDLPVFTHHPPRVPDVMPAFEAGQYVRLFGQGGELAVVLRRDGRLVCVRRPGEDLAVWWEFFYLHPVEER